MRFVIQIVGRKFDPDGEYVKKWVPELKDVPTPLIHKPWKMSEDQQIHYNVRLGIDYPHPIRDPTIGDERRKYRYFRRRGVEMPPDLEERVKLRIQTDLNGDKVNDDNNNDEDEENDDEENYGTDDEESDENDEEKNVKEIENEIKRKMNMNKKDINTDNDWYRDLSGPKLDQSANTSSSSNTDVATKTTDSTPTKTSTTKSKWRIDL